ncbi:hypothetical protein PPERSA_12769 [Pseudocohnilembus persalinus]|uniref:Uncharacterized protein n=1 Tax=Pseudocohnilembus persalinus TaxID=266149 RepID=A0A0V0QTS4_PSEPJ|nr:hypothetical protein PPERSA_12769 [Pseudocohnilembus persalinus]|eukprot:KRX05591.1 hypothetical protein PPERSA_12769 [Pseudocohnilembus persalinus]
MDIQSEQAYAKLLGLGGEEVYIRSIPVVLGGGNQEEKNIFIDNFFEIQQVTKCKEMQVLFIIFMDYFLIFYMQKSKNEHAMIYYNLQKEQFQILALNNLITNKVQMQNVQNVNQLAQEIVNAKDLSVFEKYEEIAQTLDQDSQIYFPCTQCELPHVFHFILPGKEMQQSKGLFLISSQVYAPSQNMQNPMNKSHNKQLYYQWSQDDREQLKKSILQYGYGRWRQIQKQSHVVGGSLEERNKQEVRAFANAFIRTMAMLICEPNVDLKYFLYSIIEEYPNDPYINPDPKDWDLQGQNQRAVSYSKRLQLLHRIKLLIKRFKQNQMKHLKNKNHIIWESLLNFLPNSLLLGQRPSQWWSKKHDTDLLRGVYKFGYANYSQIKSYPDYCFQELEITNQYSSFPNSDNLTRRLKKLLQTIIKFEEDKGEIKFNVQPESDEEDKGWQDSQKNCLFRYLLNFGVPLNQDGRSNWVEIREYIKQLKGFENFDRSIAQIEKMVQKFRLECQSLIIENEGNQEDENNNNLEKKNVKKEENYDQQEEIEEEGQNDKIEENKCEQQTKKNEVKQEDEEQKSDKNEDQNQEQNNQDPIQIKELINIEQDCNRPFRILYEDAVKFNKNINMIYFIRKNILVNQNVSFNVVQDDLAKQSQKIDTNAPYYIDNENYQPQKHDLKLLKFVSEKGFSGLYYDDMYAEYELDNLGLNQEIMEARLDWICTIYNSLQDNQQTLLKKRKNDKVYKDEVKKKPKFEIQRDENGNIIFPIVINNSLTLVNTGKINTLPTYHSEHNLFPVGFQTIRTHASMFNKGQKCNYHCEIMEGSDGRPLYKVISEEDPSNPIIKDSSTGCWVYICQKVNNLQEFKKDKVTISGTDRFGLLDSNVIRLLENMENAEKCTRYKFKFRNVNAMRQQEFDFN